MSCASKIATICCACALFSGCKKDPEPSSVAQPAAGGAAPSLPVPAPVTAPSALPMGVTWEDPPSWTRLNKTNPMRKATYSVPRAKGDAEDGELAVFYFGPSQGGGIDANIDRWIAQFAEVKASDQRRGNRQANGLQQHTVEIDKGTFSSGMPGGPTQPRKDYGLLGGIVESPSGAYFFKLTGPSATVKAARDSFFKLLDSVKTS